MQKKEKIIAGILIGIISILIILVSINQLSTKDVKESNHCYITLNDFNNIETNMTYQEVKNIVGCDGTVMSESQVGEYQTTIYYWYGENGVANANFTFQNDNLISKTQLGL